MRKTSQDAVDNTSITSGFDNDTKKSGISKMKKTSIKRKVQSFNEDSDDGVIEPLLQKEKPESMNQSAKYSLTKAKTETITEKGNDKDKLLTDNKMPNTSSPNQQDESESVLQIKEAISLKSSASNIAPVHNYMNVNIFNSQDGVKAIVTCKNHAMVEMNGNKPTTYTPSPTIFTTAKIHSDGKTANMEPLQITPVPILSTAEVNKSGKVTSTTSNYQNPSINIEKMLEKDTKNSVMGINQPIKPNNLTSLKSKTGDKVIENTLNKISEADLPPSSRFDIGKTSKDISANLVIDEVTKNSDIKKPDENLKNNFSKQPKHEITKHVIAEQKVSVMSPAAQAGNASQVSSQKEKHTSTKLEMDNNKYDITDNKKNTSNTIKAMNNKDIEVIKQDFVDKDSRNESTKQLHRQKTVMDESNHMDKTSNVSSFVDSVSNESSFKTSDNVTALPKTCANNEISSTIKSTQKSIQPVTGVTPKVPPSIEKYKPLKLGAPVTTIDIKPDPASQSSIAHRMPTIPATTSKPVISTITTVSPSVSKSSTVSTITSNTSDKVKLGFKPVIKSSTESKTKTDISPIEKKTNMSIPNTNITTIGNPTSNSSKKSLNTVSSATKTIDSNKTSRSSKSLTKTVENKPYTDIGSSVGKTRPNLEVADKKIASASCASKEPSNTAGNTVKAQPKSISNSAGKAVTSKIPTTSPMEAVTTKPVYTNKKTGLPKGDSRENKNSKP